MAIAVTKPAAPRTPAATKPAKEKPAKEKTILQRVFGRFAYGKNHIARVNDTVRAWETFDNKNAPADLRKLIATMTDLLSSADKIESCFAKLHETGFEAPKVKERKKLGFAVGDLVTIKPKDLEWFIKNQLIEAGQQKHLQVLRVLGGGRFYALCLEGQDEIACQVRNYQIAAR